MESFLPLDILIHIASLSVHSWKSMLSVPEFGRFSITDVGKKVAILHHSRLVKAGENLPHYIPFSDSIPHYSCYLHRWFLGYVLHRDDDLPASYPKDGVTNSDYEEWYRYGKLHRDGGPARVGMDMQIWFTNGVKKHSKNRNCETWWDLHPKTWFSTIHRDDDLPAFVFANGNREWYRYDRLHRERDKPARVLRRMDNQCWYTNGYIDRLNDLPAQIMPHKVAWRRMHLRHRENDLPAVLYSDGTMEWHSGGNKHRENDLPAVITSDGTKMWYYLGKKHRTNGLPAVIHKDGREFYFIAGSEQ
jgi:hypothetical protein